MHFLRSLTAKAARPAKEKKSLTAKAAVDAKCKLLELTPTRKREDNAKYGMATERVRGRLAT